ncbi:SapC family protein [Inhella proteolytica]|uniref:SapC family protein n=1 Tax=Inhella proteolytica TaxID=2795029 RepID=A0A931NIE6_9BURK|nr:SapC family protein [Inhella proteolytica]MBH9577490.1 SapC family protein [Inhella proteolytica]
MQLPPMYRSLVALDRAQHRNLRVRQDLINLNPAKSLNSMFLNVIEFADACQNFPIVFVRAGQGQDGKPAPLMPLAVLGLQNGENLFIKEDGTWDAEYAPAYLRRYPFAMARLDNGEQMVVCMDDQWEGFSQTEGQPMFDDKGEPTEFTQSVLKFLESYETEVERTRLVCEALDEAGILEPMRFEASMEGGQKIEVDGFLAINDEKFAKLEDAKVLDFHRRGLLQVVEYHRISMRNMRRLAAKRLQK